MATSRCRLAAAGVCAAAGLLCAACGSSARTLAARPLPVRVSQADADWDVQVGLELGDPIRVHVVNSGLEPVSVLWEECAYIDVDRQSHPVMPRSAGRTGRPLRTTIAPGTQWKDTLRVVPGSEAVPHDPILSQRRVVRWWWPLGGPKTPRIGSQIAPGSPALGKEVGVFLVLARGAEQRTVLAKYALVEEPQ